MESYNKNLDRTGNFPDSADSANSVKYLEILNIIKEYYLKIPEVIFELITEFAVHSKYNELLYNNDFSYNFYMTVPSKFIFIKQCYYDTVIVFDKYDIEYYPRRHSIILTGKNKNFPDVYYKIPTDNIIFDGVIKFSFKDSQRGRYHIMTLR